MTKEKKTRVNFTQKADKIIVDSMKEYKDHTTRYAMIQKKIPQYNSKQIRQRWTNVLNPDICHEPLDDDEKQFIIQRAEEYQTKYGKNRWVNLVKEIHTKFEKLRADNMVKNFWHLRKRKLKNLPPPEELRPIGEERNEQIEDVDDSEDEEFEDLSINDISIPEGVSLKTNLDALLLAVNAAHNKHFPKH